MRFVTFSDRDGRTRPGVADDEYVRPFNDSIARLENVIAMSAADRGSALDRLGSTIPLGDVTLKAPVRPQKNVFCVGRNYLAHAEESARARGEELKLPDVPTFFTKAPTAIADPDETIELDPTISPQYDWEAELAIVIGARCKNVSEADALSVIFGYTALNDVTARDIQRAHQQWFKGKSLDHSCPIGPWIVDAQTVGDASNLAIKLRVNGVEKQNSFTSKLIFGIPRIIAELSRGLTLEPGDVIATGTPEGVGIGRTPPEFLGDGDVMEVEIERIGVLRTPVRLAGPVYASP